MHMLLIIIGLLLLVFGGGCTLIGLGVIVYDPRGALNDPGLLATIWVPLGLLPLIAGWFLYRLGVKIDRQKLKAKAEPEAKP
jgi:hypothetical protein